MTTLRIGILGTGGMAGGHAKRINERDGCELAALCDVSLDITKAFAQRNFGDDPPQLAYYDDVDTFFAESKLDAVIIVTPHTLHFEHGMKALQAGCHIYMEKPMVTNLDHAYRLKGAVDKAGKVFVIGYNTPCTPEFNYLRNIIRNKSFGKLELVNGYLTQNWLKLTAGSWRQDPGLSGGGQAYDSGAHLFNSLVWSVEKDVAEVYAMIDNLGSPVDINSSTAIRFANGTLASIVISGNGVSADSHMVFIFENGRIEIDGWYGQWIKVFDDKGRIKYPEIDNDESHPIENFVAAIKGETEGRTSPKNGIHQSQLMDAIYESARTGRPVKPGHPVTA